MVGTVHAVSHKKITLYGTVSETSECVSERRAYITIFFKIQFFVEKRPVMLGMLCHGYK